MDNYDFTSTQNDYHAVANVGGKKELTQFWL